MRYTDLTQFITAHRALLTKGPVCLIMVEDMVEVASTIVHHLRLGFRTIVVLMPDEVALDPDLEAVVHRVVFDVHADNAMMAAVNQINDAATGAWVYYCYNAEYLMFPFCETRTVGDMLSFHAEERRDAMLTYVVDLYAGDLNANPNAVSLTDAHVDRTGYYALGRKDAANNHHPKERQLDFHGGLRWRFEEYVSWTKRKIDRISIFRAKPGLRLLPDYTFTEEEYNTFACPWHHNLTAAVCSFRTAKALRTNPGSRFEITNFRWRNSTPFEWQSQQLLDLGLMEPGQWF